MAELPDLAYNQSIPANWWETDLWTPTRFAYGVDTWGSDWGAGTDSSACMANNIYLIILYLKALGWSYQSIIATCANYQNESGLDPRNWEHPGVTSDGFGLPQWTPQSQYQHWAEDIWDPNTDPFAPYFYNGWYELYIQASEPFGYPHSQWVPVTSDPNSNPHSGSSYYPGYPPSGAPDQNYTISFKRYCAGDIPSSLVTVTDRLNYLTGAYYWNYEQVACYTEDWSLSQRRNRAIQWYNRFLPHFGDFAGRTVFQPKEAPGPDFTMNDIRTMYPAWWYKVLYMSSHKQGGLKDYAR